MTLASMGHHKKDYNVQRDRIPRRTGCIVFLIYVTFLNKFPLRGKMVKFGEINFSIL